MGFVIERKEGKLIALNASKRPSSIQDNSTFFPPEERQTLRVEGIIPTSTELINFWQTGRIARLSDIPSDYYDIIMLSIPNVGRRGLLETLRRMMVADRPPAKFSAVIDQGRYKTITGALPTEEGDGEFVATAYVTSAGVSRVRYRFSPAIEAPPPVGENIVSIKNLSERRRAKRAQNPSPVLV